MSQRPSLLVFAVTLLLGACGGTQGSPADPEPEPSSETSASGAEAKGAEEAANDEASKEELLERTLARVDAIQERLGELRSLTFKEDVPAERQDTEGFREYVVEEIARELPREKSELTSRALHHVGLLEERIDLAATLEDALVSQVGAYYDPRAGKFFVVLLSNSSKQMDTIAAHELVHALQDQHFDLRAYYGEEPKKELSEDEMNARRFVVEGEATLLMFAYLAAEMSGKDPLAGKGAGMLETQLKFMANMTVESMVKASKQQAQSYVGMDEETREALESLEDIPRYILVPLMESYTKGALPVMTVYQKGGWEAVNALYEEPPQSTEQVLHPAKKLVGDRDAPVAITLPAIRGLEGWEELHGDVMGELLWRVYFELWRPEKRGASWSDEAAAGWDGDRFAVYGSEEKTAAVFATTWDSKKEAKQFEERYLATLPERFEGLETRRRRRVTLADRPEGGEIAVLRRGADVFVVDGAPEGKGVRWARALSKAKKRAPGKGE